MPVNQWNVINSYFLNKIDYNNKKAFEMERNCSVLPAMEQFLDFLERRCSVF